MRQLVRIIAIEPLRKCVHAAGPLRAGRVLFLDSGHASVLRQLGDKHDRITPITDS